MRSVALLGLGAMGAGMARRLLDAGYSLTVWNRSPGPTARLAEAGAGVAASPRAAAESADVVISMVADDVASRAVWLGDDGALSGARSGAVLIESSTLSVGWVRELAGLAESRGCRFIDAPVSGSRNEAANGQLRFLAGGDRDLVGSLDEMFRVMGREVVWLGPVGSGAFVKLVNNFLAGVQVASAAQAVALVEASGVDADRVLEVLLGNPPASPLIKRMIPRMQARDFDMHFAVELMAKDLGYARAEAAALGIDLTTAAAALEAFQKAVREGCARKDMSAVVEPIRAAAGIGSKTAAGG